MSHKVVIYVPLGGNGKTFLTGNLAIELAARGLRVFVCDTCFSGQLSLFFNVLQEDEFPWELPGIEEFLSEEKELEELVHEPRKNLYFLPAGDTVEAEHFLRTNKQWKNKTPQIAQLAKKLEEWEASFDIFLFDTAPNLNTLLALNVFHAVDTILSPVETHKRGSLLMARFQKFLEQENEHLRESFGKSPLMINKVIPNRHDKKLLLNRGVLQELNDIFPEVLTEPIGVCTSIAKAWTKGMSLRELLDEEKRSIRSNEKQALKVISSLVDYIVKESRHEQN
jgi:cellulose biosynthesis protein BcsQ